MTAPNPDINNHAPMAKAVIISVPVPVKKSPAAARATRAAARAAATVVTTAATRAAATEPHGSTRNADAAEAAATAGIDEASEGLTTAITTAVSMATFAIIFSLMFLFPSTSFANKTTVNAENASFATAKAVEAADVAATAGTAENASGTVTATGNPTFTVAAVDNAAQAAENTTTANGSPTLKQLYYSKNFFYVYSQYLSNLDASAQQRNLTNIFQIRDIGYSVQGRPIKAVIVGNRASSIKITINATHHQKEYINTILVLNQIDKLLDLYSQNGSFQGEQVKDILDNVQIWFIPLVNPDGLELYNNYRYNGILPEGYTLQDVVVGNYNKVNLNRNYDANFHPAKSHGYYAFSEPETKTLKALHEESYFQYAVAYHSAGRKVFWYYGQKGDYYNKSLAIAKLISSATGYPLSTDENAIGASFGGYKDWLVLKKGTPAVTIETGIGALGRDNLKAVDWEQYDAIWNENKDVPLLIAQYLKANLIP